MSNIPSAPSEPIEGAAAASSAVVSGVAFKEDEEETEPKQPMRPVSERRLNKTNDVLVFRKSDTDDFVGGYGNNFFAVDQYEKPSFDSRVDGQLAHDMPAHNTD